MDENHSTIRSSMQNSGTRIPVLKPANPGQAAPAELSLARFKPWTGGLGAHRTSDTQSFGQLPSTSGIHGQKSANGRNEIPSTVRSSIQAFRSLILVLELADTGQAATAQSNLARFKLWAGSLGAERTSDTQSLTYRLRDAPRIRSHVMSLLVELRSLLGESESSCPQNPCSPLDISYVQI